MVSQTKKDSIKREKFESKLVRAFNVERNRALSRILLAVS
jgi:hypothetical protein